MLRRMRDRGRSPVRKTRGFAQGHRAYSGSGNNGREEFLIGVGILSAAMKHLVAVGLTQFERKCLGDLRRKASCSANIRPDSSSNISDQICSPVEVRSSRALTRSLPSACWIVPSSTASTFKFFPVSMGSVSPAIRATALVGRTTT